MGPCLSMPHHAPMGCLEEKKILITKTKKKKKIFEYCKIIGIRIPGYYSHHVTRHSFPQTIIFQKINKKNKLNQIMSVVGSLIFCVSCGNLLDSVNSSTGSISCGACQQKYDAKQFANLKVVTRSHEDAFPSSLRMKKSAVKTLLSKADQAAENGATIEETCPKCGNEEMIYYTLQLRSADEGATVFYTCTKCGYRTRTNN